MWTLRAALPLVSRYLEPIGIFNFFKSKFQKFLDCLELFQLPKDKFLIKPYQIILILTDSIFTNSHKTKSHFWKLTLPSKMSENFEKLLKIFKEELIERLCSINGSLLSDQQLIPYVTEKNIRLKEFQEALSEAVHIE